VIITGAVTVPPQHLQGARRMITPIEQARQHIAELARKDGEIIFSREVIAGCWDHRDDVQAALCRFQEQDA
jgi:hypothetical protein